MQNEKTTYFERKIHFSTNHGGKIFGAFSVNLSQFLTVKNDLIYFLTTSNNVVWCDREMFARIFERYRNQESVKLPKALVEARTHITLNL